VDPVMSTRSGARAEDVIVDAFSVAAEALDP